MQQLEPSASGTSSPSEGAILALEVERAIRHHGRTLREEAGLSPVAIQQQVDRLLTPNNSPAAELDQPPQNATWTQLGRLAKADPELVEARVRQVKEAARNELITGHRAARAVESRDGSAWARAQYMAIRAELVAEWQPRAGVENQLIDMLAQSLTSMLFWQERLTIYSQLEGRSSSHEEQKYQGAWELPTLESSKAIDQAMEMVDRCQKMYLRTLKALRDMRGRNLAVVVQSAGQVNIGQQQVNLVNP